MANSGGFIGPTFDVAIAGNGLIGRACALAIAARGASVALIGHDRPGSASTAAAGMLAPSVERAEGPAHDFAIAARDRYPSYLAELHATTGIAVPLNRLGVLQVALNDRGVRGLKRSVRAPSRWLDSGQLRELEPALGHALGAVLSPEEGSVDNVRLLEAMETAIRANRLVNSVPGTVNAIGASATAGSVSLADGTTLQAGHVVIALGAWTGQVAGLRYGASVEPMRGQLVAWTGAPVSRVVYGPRGYLVPRGASLIAGSTMEAVGFDADTTPEGIARIRSIAEEILPGASTVGTETAWAGLRPATPDLLPMLGPDPERPRLIYATGHSRNGVLMAPLTADCVAQLIFEDSLTFDLTQFRPDRF